MTTTAVLPAAGIEQVRAVVALVRQRRASATVIGIRALPRWDDVDSFDADGVTVHVAAAPSVLAAREALVGHRSRVDGSVLVVLTDCDEHELGLEVMGRLAGGKLYPIDRWELVRARFGAHTLDPALARAAWLGDALIRHEPPGGWPPVPSGFLDLDTAWRALASAWLGLDTDGLDWASFTRWAASGQGTAALASSADDVRRQVADQLTAHVGDPAGLVVRLVAEGRGDEVVAVGLVAPVLFGPTNDAATAAVLSQARIHLGYRLAGPDGAPHTVDDVAARRLGDGAHALVAATLRDPDGRERVEPWFAAARALLVHVQATAHAERSPALPAGLDARLACVGTAAIDALDATDPTDALAAVAHAATQVRDHLLVDREPARLAFAEAVARLTRYVATVPEPAPAVDLRDAADRYRRDGRFVDHDREVLAAGERDALLSAAGTRLLDHVGERREAENRRFAELLTGWTEHDHAPGALLPIEDLLATVAAPLVQAGTPVLVVVADALTGGIATSLVQDLRRRLGWTELAAADGADLPHVVAMLPTVTEVSRTSLLCGTPRTGTAPDEKTGFPLVAGLRRTSSAPPPIVFHKGDLTTGDGLALAPAVQAAVADPEVAAVAVVLNAVDDHLAKGQQVRVDWTAASLPPLDALLAEARDAGRVVLLTSDHGHVIDHGAQYRPLTDAAERWRPATTDPGDGELVITGPRVAKGDGTIVVPWTERLRYGAHKHGYHGGVTPQEVLVPLVLLARPDAVPDGWVGVPETRPAWWHQAAPAAEPWTPPAVAAPVTSKKSATSDAQPSLFEEPAPPATTAGPAWVAALLASDVYRAHHDAMGRRALADDRVAALLGALDRRGGSALAAALADDAGIPTVRLQGALAVLRQLLNLDGYEVLAIDGDTVRLNRALLVTQFGLDQP